MRLLVLGRGLLGSALVRLEPGHVLLQAPIPWSDPSQAVEVLTTEVRSFLAGASERWAIAWCAGTGFVGTAPDHFAIERSFLEAVLAAIANGASDAQLARGAFFLASSAGGLHGLGSREVATEATPPSPISDYGISKVLQEEMALQWAQRTGVPLLIGRISNLYGPAQNVAKPQGFISQLCRSLLIHRPFVLSVSSETERDFICADDAAARIHAWLCQSERAEGARIKVLAAGTSVTLLQLIHVVRVAAGVRPRVILAANAASRLQPRFLRFDSHELRHLDALHPARPLEVGVKQIWHSMLRDHIHGRLRA